MAGNVIEPAAWPDTGLHAAWIGHSTVLLKLDGYTVITDPIFSKRAGLSVGHWNIGIKRLAPPAVALRDLPKLDLILLSHAHMDHFDIPTLRKLEGRGATVVTAPRTADLLRTTHYRRVEELAWHHSCRAGEAKVHAFPVRHWGARMRSDTHRGYNGYIVEAGRWRVLFAGDTANTDSFRRLPTRNLDAAIIPIGAYNPWIGNHCNPEQAWRMGNEAHATYLLPVHHQTFPLGREPRLEPIERFVTAAGADCGRIAWTAIGGQLHVT